MAIKENLLSISKEIKEVCHQCKRDERSVKLIAVSKHKPVEDIIEAYNAGQREFGENNVMEAKDKFEKLADKQIKWHIIGHLQTNKIKYITNFCHLLHSLDRESLADKLQERLEFENKEMNCLIQVNTSGEDTKSGIDINSAIDFAKYVSTKNRIKIIGLMTIAENSDNEEKIRANFRDLRNVFDKIKSLNLPNFDMKELSMGMSSDFHIAIEEGATLIRVGSSIFGNRG